LVVGEGKGANSGPLTQREHLFYDRREDVTTPLRVHNIPGVMDFYDYSPDASGMTYYKEFNPGGFPIDGVPDSPVAGVGTWELVTGAQGSVTQCTGDAVAYGQSGSWIAQGIPNADPLHPPFDLLSGTRIIYYDPPGLGPSDAVRRREWAFVPPHVGAVLWP
jgi:hypothetical protein